MQKQHSKNFHFKSAIVFLVKSSKMGLLIYCISTKFSGFFQAWTISSGDWSEERNFCTELICYKILFSKLSAYSLQDCPQEAQKPCVESPEQRSCMQYFVGSENSTQNRQHMVITSLSRAIPTLCLYLDQALQKKHQVWFNSWYSVPLYISRGSRIVIS